MILTLQNLLEHPVNQYLFRMTQKIVDVKLPRLLLQIMHEWSSPAEKKVGQIKDENDEALEGDYIGVYQDVFLEMIESDADHSFLSEDIDNRNAATEIEFHVNKPFMVLVKMDHELLAVGRVMDPHWCKFCHSHKKGGYKTRKLRNSRNLRKITQMSYNSKNPQITQLFY